MVTAGMATVGRHHWILAAYLLSLVPTFVFMGRYVRKFALDKAKMLDLQKSCFEVAHLSLPANQKRQKRRYLLALNTLCETWQPALAEVPVVSVSKLEQIKAAAWLSSIFNGGNRPELQLQWLGVPEATAHWRPSH